jgi:hypothetical protein
MALGHGMNVVALVARCRVRAAHRLDHPVIETALGAGLSGRSDHHVSKTALGMGLSGITP